MSPDPAVTGGGRRRGAVIGSGVAGLTAAYVLNRQDDVTLFEADSRLGGHAHTHDMPQADGSTIGVDTGFIVHNTRT
ncbi:MAG TPA: FAD-dependent oxidoreductase, partial [Arthrobacter sp.]